MVRGLAQTPRRLAIAACTQPIVSAHHDPGAADTKETRSPPNILGPSDAGAPRTYASLNRFIAVAKAKGASYYADGERCVTVTIEFRSLRVGQQVNHDEGEQDAR